MASLTIKDTDFKFCEICDNYVPEIFIETEDEFGCQYCWEAYGEIH